MTTEQMKDAIVKILDEKKTDSIECLSVADKTVIADYFLIVTVKSGLAVRTLAEFLEEKTKNDKDLCVIHKDGTAQSGWMVLDFGGVMVHIFTQEKKEVYSIEKLWSNKKTAEA